MNYPFDKIVFSLFLTLLVMVQTTKSNAGEKPHDIVIYGGTSSGIVAAIQAKKMGKSVVLIEPGNRIGGLTTGGLGQTDIGNKTAIGGISRKFYEAIKAHYLDPASWNWQSASDYKDGGQSRTNEGEPTMWTFEPHVALDIFNDWIKRDQIEVIYGERLNRKAGVKMEGNRIVSIAMESGRTFPGRIFIDATYEGDLMAACKVSYVVGREGNVQYGENYDGVQPNASWHYQMAPNVDPYVKQGDPSSGLLPFFNAGGPGKEGEGDKGVQAYCYRMCLTSIPENRVPFEKPDGYNEQWYELLFRNLAAQKPPVIPWINSSMPNGKTDTNDKGGVAIDFIGQNYGYPDGSYAEREAIAKKHLLYQKGLMWTLANHPRVPKEIRDVVSQWGTCKDEFQDTGGWPGQLYIREARRMVSDYVMTQRNCQGAVKAPNPVALGAYTMDSHSVQRYVDEHGFARNEGNLVIKGSPPYPVDYFAIVPKEKECNNLLVPVCLSATHIAYGSIRMEPAFMVLGQSAATAAAQAIEEDKPVQQINLQKLHARLLKDGQILEWTPPSHYSPPENSRS